MILQRAYEHLQTAMLAYYDLVKPNTPERMEEAFHDISLVMTEAHRIWCKEQNERNKNK